MIYACAKFMFFLSNDSSEKLISMENCQFIADRCANTSIIKNDIGLTSCTMPINMSLKCAFS